MKPRDAVLFDIRTIAALLALIFLLPPLSLLIIIFIKTLLIMRLIEL